MDTFISPSVVGIIDRAKPEMFGNGYLPGRNALYYPGDRISATFSEAIDCSTPYEFSATLDFGDAIGTMLLSQPTNGQVPQLTTFCKDNVITLDISTTAGIVVRLL